MTPSLSSSDSQTASFLDSSQPITVSNNSTTRGIGKITPSRVGGRNTRQRIEEFATNRLNTISIERDLIPKILNGIPIKALNALNIESEELKKAKNILIFWEVLSYEISKPLSLSQLIQQSTSQEIVNQASYFEEWCSTNQATLAQITSLALFEKKLKELPQQIAWLTNLLNLNLCSNQLRELPPEIASLKKLNILRVDGNQLVKFPDHIVQLTELQVLDISNNQINYLPVEIGQLCNLKNLGIDHTPLRLLPFGMKNLKRLEQLYLSYGQIPLLLSGGEWFLKTQPQVELIAIRGKEAYLLPKDPDQLKSIWIEKAIADQF